MAQKRVGVIPFRSGAQADPFKIPIRDPITFIDVVLTGVITVTVATTLVEDNILNLLKRIQLVLGGRVKKTIGDNSPYGSAGRILYYSNPALFGNSPPFVAPGTGVAAHAFKAVLRIPVQMPPLLSRNMNPLAFVKATALHIGSEDLELFVDWGTTADVWSAGTATFTTAPSIEVVVGYDPSLGNVPQAFDFHEHTQSLALASGAGANADFTDDLSKVGIVPYAFLLGFDNSVRADAVWNRLDFKINEQIDIIDGSWDFFKSMWQTAPQLQAVTPPVGVGLALFDQEMDGGGFLQINDPAVVSAWKLHLDHDALTSINRLYVHQYALVAR